MNRKQKRIDKWLVGILTLAVALNFMNIWEDEYVNPYYTSAVKSMMQNLHNFFFASFDPAGFVTVDKPPVAFWIQTISAKIFGFHGWSVILPQALAGVGSVILLYVMIKKIFGVAAGRIAALTMAITPIVPAVSRTNNIDSLLVFILLVATWMLFKAVAMKKHRWLFLAFVLIGVGFNMKMMQAYMVLPAFYLFYWLAAKIDWKKKIGLLSGATVLLIVVSLSWATIVDLIPEDKRPYIGSSETNSVLELALGYNGISRLTGEMSSGGSNGQNEQPIPPSGNMQDEPPLANEELQTGENTADSSDNENQQNSNLDSGQDLNFKNAPGGQFPPQMDGDNNGPGGGNTGRFNTGTPGVFRLIQDGLADQISWFLPLAIVSIIGLLSGVRLKETLSTKVLHTIFWLAWLVPVALFFSIAGFFHQYYLIMLAPPIAAVIGAGLPVLWKAYRKNEGWKSWLLPIGIALTAGLQVSIMLPDKETIGLTFILVVGIIGIILALALAVIKQRSAINTYMMTAALIVLVIGPLYWAMTPILYGGNSMLPEAGPTSSKDGQLPQIDDMAFPGDEQDVSMNNDNQVGTNEAPNDEKSPTNREKRNDGPGMNGQVNQSLLTFLEKNRNGTKYLFATLDSTTAAPYIIETGEAVMTMGGFSGADSILTVTKLEELVESGDVHYFLIGNRGMGGNAEIISWIQENGTEVSAEEWRENEDNQQVGPGGGASKLYYVDMEGEE
ncbi:glycosyltransferase family 39 protein [Bacillus sp. 1780r2a1]|nr:glycosyltransferase family 39 protein [Bacillus sp. 1780r2a1]